MSSAPFRGSWLAAAGARAALGGFALFTARPAVLAQTGTEFPRSRAPTSDSPMRMMERQPIFFPPNPPPIGIPVARAAVTPGRLAAPRELSAFINDPFYPMLGTRLFTRTLSDKLATQLEQYRATKVALQAELRTELQRLRDTESDARHQALVVFARDQTPKIAALEKTAEQLRQDLAANDFDWSALREWHLGDKDKRGFSPVEIAQVMRAYAFYQNGLLPAQRRLLREIAIELAMAGDSTASATAAQPYLFFPPEPARVLLPDDLPANVAAKVAAYQTRKSALKKELYDTVHAHDGATFAFFRRTLKTLADKQAPRLAELETIAEEIRAGLPGGAEIVRRNESSPVPPVLTARVAALMQNYTAAQKDAAARIDAILARAKDLPMQATYRFEADGLKFLLIPSRTLRRESAGEVAPKIDAVRAEIAAVADDYGRQLADLTNERGAISNAVGEAMGGSAPRAVDAALTTAMRLALQKQNEDAYTEYRTAVLQPGLSPEQRRLLFDAVIERLELPLLRAEMQPTRRSATW